jgi:Gpi18-like mannosyltransferase
LLAYLVLRWFLGTLPGYQVDVLAYKRWAIGAAHNGLSGVYENTDMDYPPLYAYILYPIGAVYLSVEPETPEGRVPDSTLLTLLMKLPPFVFDLLLAGLLYLFVARRKLWGEERAGPRWGRLAAVFYLWNPVVLWDSAYWGQPDGIHSFFVVACLALLGRSHSVGAGASLSAAGMMKPLAAPLVPLVALVAFARDRWRGLLLVALSAVVVALLLFLPFLLTGRGQSVLDRVVLDVEAMPYTSVNGHNYWWIVGPWQDANAPLLGPLSAKHIGMGLFGIFALALLVRAWPWLRRQAAGPGLEAGLFAIAASITGVFFFFSTHMHENHLFMAVPLTAALALRSRRWFWLFLGTTVGVFLNVILHDLEVTLGAPFTWGGVSPVMNLHLERPFAWGELVGTYLDAALIAVVVGGIYVTTWCKLRLDSRGSRTGLTEDPAVG